MDTWALQAAAHAALTSGYGPSRFPLGGSASLDGFALGVMVAGLAFLALNSSLKSPWRPRSSRWQADGWQHQVRWPRIAVPRRAAATASAETTTPSAGTPAESSRPYADLTEPTDESAGKPLRRSMPDDDESFWAPRKGGGYHSKHRVPESAERAEYGEPLGPDERDDLEQPRSHRRPAPRHAAS